MKIFLENYNGVLDIVEDMLDERGQLTDNPHEADCFLLWQDVRGVPRELARLAKNALKKPVVVMQHGRGATRDYCPPNKFELLADNILVWGESEKKRLIQVGINSEKIIVTGCPLLPRLKPRSPERLGKNVLFVPVIAQKEEPENLLVYAALKIWESQKLIGTVQTHFNDMKRAWAWQNDEMREVLNPDGTKEKRLWKRDIKNILPRWITYGGGLVNVKLSGVHDMYQYQAPLVVSGQNDPNLIDGMAELLANIDVMVCLEEGTMQLMAHALGIPVIVADIFRYENYGGCKDYDSVEKIKTSACYWTKNLSRLGNMIDHALSHPNELKRQREIVVEEEGALSLGDANANAIRAIEAIAVKPEAVAV